MMGTMMSVENCIKNVPDLKEFPNTVELVLFGFSSRTEGGER